MARPHGAARAEEFRALHHGRAPEDPLVLPGPWDAASARVFAEAGFPALATPSAGMAASLGYEDGHTPADEMFAAVARIVRAVDVPVSADLEDGYGLPPEELAARVLDAGVAGVNLEDGGPGGLADPAAHADRLAEFRAAVGGAVFLNARVDTYVRGVPDPEETVRRARLYAEAGADCVYPLLAPPDLLPVLRAEAGVPLNAFAAPGGPPPAELGRLGASRITCGPVLHERAVAALRGIAAALRDGAGAG
ncbi:MULTISPECIES: isocitrate lyase/PEP mutase family protein [Streptomyces]|uniref:Isocitrate lyase/phosphoenolpyruvate mutase family protein n=1 Tax=Streptomyces sudanensis TaxID=436397 RepID=A0ABY4TBB4_9ACTN|nr:MULTISPECIES: isocitrate lyase/phosphoenolpyruvate mutase family protein [Streptomyces]URN15329.1 isocitrate lyase/phosphoenolpyruvate mutase family protein [Streptomyces sudanensis]